MRMLKQITNIASAYERDMLQNGGHQLAPFELPTSYEAITSEWLTAIARTIDSGASIAGYRLEIPDHGGSKRRRIHVEYNKSADENALPETLFCKATHDLSSRIVAGVLGDCRSEVAFYLNIRPLLDIEAPRALFCRFDPESCNSIIVLPDLASAVTEFCSHTTTMSRERVESQLALLARLHSGCYEGTHVNSLLGDFPSWPEYFARLALLEIEEVANQGLLAAKRVIPPRLYEKSASVWPAARASVQRHIHLPKTLIHGDVHLKNWYVARNGEMGLSDWETASRGHWSRDVTHTILTSLAVDRRRAWEEDLLRYYLDRMIAGGAPAGTFGDAWKNYRQQALSVLVWWTFTLAGELEFDATSTDVTMEFVRRAAVAVDDLQSLDSF